MTQASTRPPAGGYLDVHGKQVHFLSAGAGERTLFLLHETPLSAKSYAPAIAHLQDHFRVIAFDTPGYGNSAPLDGPPRIEAYAEVLWQAMQQVRRGPFAIAAIHTGASLALEIARAHADAVLVGMVLSGVPLLPPAQVKGLLDRIRGRAGKTDGETVLAPWHDRAGRWYKAGPELLIQAMADELQVFARRDWAFEAVAAYDVRPALAGLRCPTLLLNGAHDSLGPIDAQVAQAYPQLAFRLLPDWGGQLQWTAAEVYARHITDFLLPKFAAAA